MSEIDEAYRVMDLDEKQEFYRKKEQQNALGEILKKYNSIPPKMKDGYGLEIDPVL